MPGPNPHQLSSASPRMPCEPASSRQMRHYAHHLHSNLAPMGRTQRIYGSLSYIPTAVGIQSQGTHILSHILRKSARGRRRKSAPREFCPRASSIIPQSHMGATRDHETRRLAERRSAAGMPRLQTNQLRRFAKSAPLPLRLRFAIQNLFSLPMHGGFQARSIRRNVSEAPFASHRSSFPKPPSRTPSHPRHEPGYARHEYWLFVNNSPTIPCSVAERRNPLQATELLLSRGSVARALAPLLRKAPHFVRRPT